jgi:ribonuclease HI
MADPARTAVLLRELSRGRPLAEAAETADFDLDQAQDALAELAERLGQRAKKLRREDERAERQAARAARTIGDPDKLVFVFDGGSRGNPGPAAGVGLALDEDGAALAERSRYFPEATNNFAEYQGLLAAIDLAAHLKVRKLHLRGDSELVVKQMNGEYKIKNPDLIKLSIEAHRALRQFQSWSISYLPRDKNNKADRAANRILNEKAPKKKKGELVP